MFNGQEKLQPRENNEPCVEGVKDLIVITCQKLLVIDSNRTFLFPDTGNNIVSQELLRKA